MDTNKQPRVAAMCWAGLADGMYMYTVGIAKIKPTEISSAASGGIYAKICIHENFPLSLVHNEPVPQVSCHSYQIIEGTWFEIQRTERIRWCTGYLNQLFEFRC